jgi:putative nucleotidyltransferase with HDIG domain
MKELKYVDKIRSGDSLLSMPQSLSQILSMINSDDFSMDDLGDIILKDPGLTSKVLKMANSAFYRQQSEISTVNQAVVMLGVMQVKCLALSASVFHKEDLEKQNKINFKDLFSHFISVALGCRMLAKAVEFKGAEEAFIAGLLHDIGLVFFIHHFPEDYRNVVDKINIYPNLIEAERDILGIDHAAIGQLMAEKWNFPESLCDAIGQHHKIADHVDEIELKHLVQLSELINKPAIDDRPRNLERRLGFIDHLSKIMNIDRKAIDEISFSLLTETIATAEYLGIDIGDTYEVVTRANKELYNSYMTIEKLFRERQDLSLRILKEERRAAMMETKNIAIATLSHYINNAAMAISGRGQLIKMLVTKGVIEDKDKRLEPIADVVEKSVNKIMAVLQELRDLTNLDDIEKYSESEAINIDDRIKERLQKMENGGMECVVQPPEINR